MSLFSFLRKNKQETASDDSTFYSRAEEDSNKIRGRSRRRQGGQDNQANEPADPVLPEKKRARRRLIGAVALVLAAVIGLPMVLDSEPKPLASDIAIHIPSKDKPVAPGAQVATTAGVTKISASAALDPQEEVIDPPAAVEAPAPKPAADTAKLQARPLPVAKSESNTESGQAAKKSDETARAQALLDGKPDPKVDENKAGKYVIQVAALASKEKVDELQAKLKGAGVKSYTQKIATQSGERIRIRVGPFASKEEAEKVRAKIVKLGLNGTLVPA